MKNFKSTIPFNNLIEIDETDPLRVEPLIDDLEDVKLPEDKTVNDLSVEKTSKPETKDNRTPEEIWLDDLTASPRAIKGVKIDESLLEPVTGVGGEVDESLLEPVENSPEWNMSRLGNDKLLRAFEDDPLAVFDDSPQLKGEIARTLSDMNDGDIEAKKWALSAYYSKLNRRDVRDNHRDLEALNQWYLGGGGGNKKISIESAYSEIKKDLNPTLRDPSFAGKNLYSFASGYSSTISGILNIASMPQELIRIYEGATLPEERLEKMIKLYNPARGLSKYYEKLAQNFQQDSQVNHDFITNLVTGKGNFKDTMIGTSQMLPELLTQVYVGSIGTPGLNMAYIGAKVFANQYYELQEEHPDMSTMQKVINIFGNVSAEVLLEMGTERIFAGGGIPMRRAIKHLWEEATKNLSKKATKNLSKEAIGKIRKEITKKLTKEATKRATKNATKSATKKFAEKGLIRYMGESAIQEAVQETVQSAASELVNVFTGFYGDYHNLSTSDKLRYIFQDSPEEAYGGFIGGILFGAVGYRNVRFFSKMRNAAIASIDESIKLIEAKEQPTDMEIQTLDRLKRIKDTADPRRLITEALIAKLTEAERALTPAELDRVLEQPTQEGKDVAYVDLMKDKILKKIALQEAEAVKSRAVLEHDPAQTRKTAIELMSKFPDVKLVIVDSENAIPKDVKKDIKNQGLDIKLTRAWVSDNTVYIRSDKVAPSEVSRVVGHEVIGHFGLRKVFGDDLNELLDNVFKSHSKEIEKLMIPYNRDLETIENQRYLTEEYLANIADADVKPSWWKEFLFKIKNRLRSMEKFKDMRFTDKDIEGMLSMSARAMRKKGGDISIDDVRFSFGKKFNANYEREVLNGGKFDWKQDVANIEENAKLDAIETDQSWESIQDNYEKSAGDASTGIDLRNYVESGNGEVHRFDEGVLITNTMASEQFGVPIISHWAPNSARDGVALLGRLGNSNEKYVAVVTPSMANQLKKLGWTDNGNTSQMFKGEMIDKVIMATKGVSSQEQSIDSGDTELDIKAKIEGAKTEADNIKYSIRTEPRHKKVKVFYKCFAMFPDQPGKLFPPMVKNPNSEPTPVGVWINADVAEGAKPSKTGRPQVRKGGKGTNTKSPGSLAFRPGLHSGLLPIANQFNRIDPEGGSTKLFPENFVWMEVLVPDDVDYQQEAYNTGINKNGNFVGNLVSLGRIPEGGYYRYGKKQELTDSDWAISGSMIAYRILSDADVSDILAQNNVPMWKRWGGEMDLEKWGLKRGEVEGQKGVVHPDGYGLSAKEKAFIKEHSKRITEAGAKNYKYSVAEMSEADRASIVAILRPFAGYEMAHDINVYLKHLESEYGIRGISDRAIKPLVLQAIAVNVKEAQAAMDIQAETESSMTEDDKQRLFETTSRSALEQEVMNIIETKTVITEDWARENPLIFNELCKQLLHEQSQDANSVTDVNFELSKDVKIEDIIDRANDGRTEKGDIEYLNTVIQKQKIEIEKLKKKYESEKKADYEAYLKELSTLHGLVLNDKVDIAELQRRAHQFAIDYLPKENQGEFTRGILDLAKYSSRITPKHPESERGTQFNKLIDAITARGDNLKREHLINNMKEMAYALREKVNYKGILTSVLPESQRQVNRILEVLGMNPKSVETAMEFNTSEILRLENEESNDDYKVALVEDNAILELFGNLSEKPVESSSIAERTLAGLIRGGKREVLTKMQKRLGEISDMKARAINDATFGKNIFEADMDADKYGKLRLKSHDLLTILHMISGKNGADFHNSVAGELYDRVYEAIHDNENFLYHAQDWLDSTMGITKKESEAYLSIKAMAKRGKFLKRVNEKVKKSGVFKLEYSSEINLGKDKKQKVTKIGQRERINTFVPIEDFDVNGLKKQGIRSFIKDIDTGKVKRSKKGYFYNGVAISDAALYFLRQQITDFDAGVNKRHDLFNDKTDDDLYRRVSENIIAGNVLVFSPATKGIVTEVEVELSQGTALQILLTWEQEGYREIMKWNGWTENSIAQLKEFIEPDVLQIGYKMREYIAKQKSALEEKTLSHYGSRMPNIKNYFPAVFKGMGMGIDQGGLTRGAGSLDINPDFLIARTFHLSPLDTSANAISSFMSYQLQAGHFLAWSDVVRDLRAVYGDKNVQSAINANMGEKVTARLLEIIGTISAGGSKYSTEYGSRLLNNMFRYWVSAKIGLNPSSHIKQLFAVCGYMNEMPIDQFIKYMSMANFANPKYREWIKWAKDTDYYKHRVRGGMNKDLIYLINYFRDAKSYNPWSDGLVRGLTLGTRLTDSISTLNGGFACYQYNYDKAIKDGETKARAKEIAHKAWMFTNDRTQQTGYLAQQNAFQVNQGAYRYMTTFLSAPIQLLNLQMQKRLDYKHATSEKKAQARKDYYRGLLVNHFVLPTLMQFASDMLRGGLDPEEFMDEVQFSDYFISWCMGQYSSLFIVGKVLESGLLAGSDAIQGKRPFVQRFSALPMVDEAFVGALDIAKLFGEDEVTEKELLNAVAGIGAMTILTSPITGSAVGAVGALFSSMGTQGKRLMKVLGVTDKKKKKGDRANVYINR